MGAAFLELKEKLEQQYKLKYPSCQLDIRDWTGKDIRQFQEELGREVGGYISEKWFYTHIKKEQKEKLPRVDVLNMLCRYVGYRSWAAFLEDRVAKENTENRKIESNKQNDSTKIALMGIVSFIVVAVLFGLNAVGEKKNSATLVSTICLVDADTKQAIKSEEIEVSLIDGGIIEVDSMGCIRCPSKQESFCVAIDAPYYHRDTVCFNSTYKPSIITLRKDDYALMIHYFSATKLKDWKRRRRQLDKMLSDEATIIQVSEDEKFGIEMYNKQEFINKMTTPLKSLQNIQILKTDYLKDKIIHIRFKTLKDE